MFAQASAESIGAHQEGRTPVSFRQLITGAVAAASFGLALDQGGFSAGVFSGSSLAIWWALLVASALGLGASGRPPRAVLAGAISLALLAAWSLASFAWASDGGRVFEEVVRDLFYLGAFVLVAVCARRGEARPWLDGLAIGLTGVCAVALASRIDPSFGTGAFPGSRLNYPIGYWNGLAASAATALALLAWASAAASTRGARALVTAALPLPVLTIFLPASRGGAVAAVLALAILLVLSGERGRLVASLLLAGAVSAALVLFIHGEGAFMDGVGGAEATRQGRVVLAALIGSVAILGAARHWLDARLPALSVPPRARRVAAVLAVLITLGLVVAADPVARLDSFKQPPAASTSGSTSANFTNDNGAGRYQFWSSASDAFDHHPLLGIGAGQFSSWWSQHGSIYFIVRDAHSLPLQTAAELGLVGLALLLFFLFVPLRCAWTRARGEHRAEVAALLAIFAAGVFSASIDWIWQLPAVFGPVVVAAALLSGAATEAAPAGGARSPRPRRGPRIAAIAVAVAAVGLSADLLLTRLALDRSQAAARTGDLPGAAAAAADAIALQPWASEPRLQLGLVQEQGGRSELAIANLQGAAARAPEDWRIPYLLAGAQRRAGQTAAARASLRRALGLDPRSPLLRRAVARRG